jgi:hypothetical protein
MAAQLTLGGFLVSLDLYRAREYEKRKLGLASRPPFYGGWVVDEFYLGGRVLPPLLTDETRWQRVVFQFPEEVGIQSMNGAWAEYRVRRDMTKKTFAMERANDPKKEFDLSFSSPNSESLILEGSAGGSEIRVRLRRMDEEQFPLLRRRFHWMSEDADFMRDAEGVCDHVRGASGALLMR